MTVAQFLAYFNDRSGIYLACHDTTGNIKLIRPVHHEPGCRLGIAYVGDWPQQGERTLEYDIVLGSFQGDWYAAANYTGSGACNKLVSGGRERERTTNASNGGLR